MKVNKVLIVSLPLIYSTNVFSNNSMAEPYSASHQDITKFKVYFSDFAHSKDEQKKRIDGYYQSYISSSDNGDEVTIAKPLFEEIIQSLTTKNPSLDTRLIKESGFIDLTNYSKKEKEEISNKLDNEYKKLNDQQSPNTQAKQDLLKKIKVFSQTIKDSADNKTLIIRVNKIMAESAHDVANYHLQMTTPVEQGALAEIESKIVNMHGDLSQKTRRIGDVEKIANKNKKNLEFQKKEIGEVKEITNENKELVDKYLVNDFQVNGESKNLTSHLNSLYMENILNRKSINSVRNDFEHFKHETNNRFYKVEKRANQGIASVAAMSNLPFTDTATFSTAIGIGNYRNATALAWGMQYRINENIKVRASTAWNDSNSFVSAGGVGISW